MSKSLKIIVGMSFILFIALSFTNFSSRVYAATGNTYYIDSVNGNDANDGTSTSTPWKTLAKVNVTTFQPGDNIFFKKGDVWREQLNISSSGSEGNPITFGVYGSGAAPIFTGTDVPTWSQDIQISSTTLSGEVISGAARNVRQTILGSRLSSMNGTSARFLFIAPPSSTTTILDSSIGISSSTVPYDFDGSPTRITFDGENSITLGPGESKWSDWIPIVIDPSNNYLFAFYGASSTGNGSSNFYMSASGDGVAVGENTYRGGSDDTDESMNGAVSYSLWNPDVQQVVSNIEVRKANVWAATVTTQPYTVWFDDSPGSEESSMNAVTADTDWYWASNTLLTYDTSNPSTDYNVEVGQRTYDIYSNGKNYFTLDGLDVTRAEFDGIRIENSIGVKVNDVNSSYNGRDALQGEGIEFASSTSLSITNSTSFENGWNGFGVEATTTGATLSHNHSYDNGHQGFDFKVQDYNWEALDIHGGIIPTGPISDVSISYCTANGNGTNTSSEGHGIYFEDDVANHISNVNVYRNVSYSNSSQGILFNPDTGNAIDNVHVYNNTLYNNGLIFYGAGISAQVTDSNVYNNILLDDQVSEVSNITEILVETMGGATNTLDYDQVYNSHTPKIQVDSGILTFAAAQAAGYETHGDDGDPLISNATSGNFNLSALSPAIDAGTTTSATIDFSGDPIYGTPDRGAYEYQPPYIMGTDEINPTGAIRIYQDGKYRYTSATSSTSSIDFTVTPLGGSFYSYSSTTTRPSWLDLSNITWNTSGTYSKKWTATGQGATTTVFTVGDLQPNHWYTISVDSVATSTEETDSNGRISYTYTGGWSTHTFSVDSTSTSSATSTYYIDSINGNDANDGISTSTSWQTLAKVNSMTLQPGDTVLFKKGDTWQGSLVIPSSGTEENPITFSSYGSGASPIIDGNGSQYTITATSGTSYITIDGLDITDTGTLNATQVSINIPAGATNWTIENSTIHGTTEKPLRYGIFMGSTTGGNHTIRDNTFQYINDRGIYSWIPTSTDLRTNMLITGNTFDHITGGGGGKEFAIVGSFNAGSVISNNTITNSSESSPGSHAMYIYSSDGTGDPVQIKYNKIDHSGGTNDQVLKLGVSNKYIDIFYNLISNSSDGIDVDSIDASETNSYINIYNNTLANLTSNNATGINLIYVDNVNIKNNLLYEVNGTSTVKTKYNISLQNVTNAVFSNNLAYSADPWNSGGDIYAYNDEDFAYYKMADWNALAGTIAVGTDTWDVDPSLTDPNNDDYSLQAGSPAIDAGVDVGLNQDILGNPIVGAPDIGAYETNYSSNESPVAAVSPIEHLPTGSATGTLDASTSHDPDGSIVSYHWVYDTTLMPDNLAPVNPTIETPDSATSTVTGLLDGYEYIFHVTVTDNDGATDDEYQVIFTAKLDADAGENQILNAGISSTTLTGSGTSSNATINSYHWSTENGATITSPDSADTTVTGLQNGNSYTFTLTITDNLGDTTADNVIVEVANESGNTPPIADAGEDQILSIGTTTAVLDGSASSDNNSISSYAWTKVSGSGTITNSSLATTTVTGLSPGTSIFQLLVTDGDGATSSDEVSIKVQSPTVYYVSSSLGSDSNDGLTPASPWKTLSKVNSFTYKAGDTIAFKRGDTFNGTIVTSHSGTAESPIIYTAYGTGDDPIISGFTQLTSWTKYSNNIYSADLDVDTLNVVTLNGTVEAMGRYPETGYLTYTSHSDNSSISGDSVSTIPFGATGAEVVIRKIRQVTDRHQITSVSGNTINYSSDSQSSHGNNTAYSPNDGNGYFIQGNINTLNSNGDWYYDSVNKKLYMYFSDGTPDGKIVKASTEDKNVDLNNDNYITFQDISFEGANTDAVSSINDIGISFQDSNFSKTYNGFFGYDINNLTISNSDFNNILNNAVWYGTDASNVTVTNSSFEDIATIPGAGGSGDGQYEAVELANYATSTDSGHFTVSSSTFNDLGFHGISLYGNNTLVENNVINNFCLVKDDCGAVYESQSAGVINNNKIIRNNLILNAIGVVAGAPSYEQYGKAAGIYLDANVNNVQVTGNTIAHGAWGGIVCLGCESTTIENNTVYDFAEGLNLQSYVNPTISDLTVLNNKFISKTETQIPFYTSFQDNYHLIGTLNNNYYARPLDDNSVVQLNIDNSISNKTLADWQTYSSQDANSKGSPVEVSTTSDILFNYNDSSSSKVINLSNNYVDMDGNTKTGNVTLTPDSGLVLLKNTNQTSTTQTTSWGGLISGGSPYTPPVVTTCPNGSLVNGVCTTYSDSENNNHQNNGNDNNNSSSNSQAIITTPTLNVRTSPTTASDVLTQIHKGDTVEVLDTLPGWLKIKTADGTVSYISSDYAKVTTENSAPTTNSSQAVITTNTLNVRTSPTTASDVLTQIHKGDTVEVLGTLPGWLKIKTADGTVSYISSNYARVTNTNINNNSNSNEESNSYTTITTPTLNVRTSPTTASKITSQVHEGEQVEVLQTLKNWLKIETNGTIGYVFSEYTSGVSTPSTKEVNSQSDNPQNNNDQTTPNQNNSSTSTTQMLTNNGVTITFTYDSKNQTEGNTNSNDQNNESDNSSSIFSASSTIASLRITSPQVNIYESPDLSSSVLTTLTAGDRVSIVEVLNGWFQVFTENGVEGYMRN